MQKQKLNKIKPDLIKIFADFFLEKNEPIEKKPENIKYFIFFNLLESLIVNLPRSIKSEQNYLRFNKDYLSEDYSEVKKHKKYLTAKFKEIGIIYIDYFFDYFILFDVSSIKRCAYGKNNKKYFIKLYNRYFSDLLKDIFVKCDVQKTNIIKNKDILLNKVVLLLPGKIKYALNNNCKNISIDEEYFDDFRSFVFKSIKYDIENMLKENNVKYKKSLFGFGNKIIISVDELKKFSNYEKLTLLL